MLRFIFVPCFYYVSSNVIYLFVYTILVCCIPTENTHIKFLGILVTQNKSKPNQILLIQQQYTHLNFKQFIQKDRRMETECRLLLTLVIELKLAASVTFDAHIFTEVAMAIMLVLQLNASSDNLKVIFMLRLPIMSIIQNTKIKNQINLKILYVKRHLNIFNTEIIFYGWQVIIALTEKDVDQIKDCHNRPIS